MQKHRTEQHQRGSRMANANWTLGDACRLKLKSVTDGLASGDFASDYLRSQYLSKFNGPGTASAGERRSAAIRKWENQERVNARTNERLRGLDRGYNVLPRVSFYRFLEVAQRHIYNVLGDLSDEICLGSFSGGASTGRRRTESQPAHKFCGMADATEGAIPYVDLIHRQSELYRQYSVFYSLREVDGAVLFTVPKNADIDRCACKEPEINMYLQKGVGRHIRRQLLRHGINLNDQSINRELARQGSRDNTLATLDLSSASDSVTIQAVRALLPTEWFLYLNDIRSQSVVVDGRISATEMFSSMGNGFTFELESLIFWALMKATAYLRGHSGVISVYGDDIIIPSGMYDDAIWILSEFGFSANPEKSFSTGPFRESCGGHYHNGDDVTPFYLRREPESLTDLIRITNQLRRWALADPGRQYLHPNLWDLWSSLVREIPVSLRGGRDCALDTQAVSSDLPHSVLQRVGKDPKLPHLGLYVHWHTTVRNRTSDPLEGFTPVSTNNFCRIRRAKPGAVADLLYFRQELE